MEERPKFTLLEAIDAVWAHELALIDLAAERAAEQRAAPPKTEDPGP